MPENKPEDKTDKECIKTKKSKMTAKKEGPEKLPVKNLKIDFVKKYHKLFEKIGKELDIDPDFVGTQSALESTWGTSPAVKINNIFGQKYKHGKKYENIHFDSVEESGKKYVKMMNEKWPSVKGTKSLDRFLSVIEDGKESKFKYCADKIPEYKIEIKNVYKSYVAAKKQAGFK